MLARQRCAFANGKGCLVHLHLDSLAMFSLRRKAFLEADAVCLRGTTPSNAVCLIQSGTRYWYVMRYVYNAVCLIGNGQYVMRYV